MNYPDLTNTPMLAIDIETYDPGLIEHGPGVFRDDGKILGVSISDGSFKGYYSIAHSDTLPEVRRKNLVYLKELFKKPMPKVGANFAYDLDWLVNGYNFEINGPLHDIQLAEPLLDSYRNSFSLDSLAKDYLDKGKYKFEIEDFCNERKLKGDPRKHLHLMPSDLVGRYAEEDALETIQIFEKQLILLKEEELLDLYELEASLIRPLLEMRKNGVRIDVKKLEHNIDYTDNEVRKLEREFKSIYGEDDTGSPKVLKRLFDINGVDYPLTEKGNPSFNKATLEKIDHDIAKRILSIRKLKTSRSFLEESFYKNLVGDRIHCTFNQLRKDGAGTVTGRMSSTNPNLQQVTSVKDGEDEETGLGHLARGIFIPEEGCLWGKPDYSQIEYRIFSHYALGPKSDDVRKQFNDDPTTDYHQWVMDQTNLDRKSAKRLNFGTLYGMGARTCSVNFNWSMEKATSLLNMYHREIPFVRYTMNQVVKMAQARDFQTKGKGYVKTILGRKARISEEMREFRREYKIFNYLIQGSAADVMKKAISDAYKKGLFTPLKMHLVVHDELDFSFAPTKEGYEAYKELQETMETCVKLKLPVIAECEYGENWADLKKLNFEEVLK